MNLFAPTILLALAGVTGAAQAQDAAVDCGNCAEWNQPVKPFKVFGNTWYVGVKGISAVLVTSPQGHILLDGALPQSAPLIEANIKALGFRMEDVKYILNSHAHWDHAGGIAALQRASGAVVVASKSGALVLNNGASGSDDPQYDAAEVIKVATVDKVKVVGEGERIKVGKLALTAHMTPGHTPGATTWTWTSCEGARCLNVVYADSLNPYASDSFKFTGSGSGAGKTPDISASFAASIAKVAALKCDIVLSVHPSASNMLEKEAAHTASSNPFIDPNGCRDYAATAGKLLAERLAKERAGKVVASAHTH
jgi:metallo-beta-lactamase class B